MDTELNKIFGHYIGQQILPLRRITCDWDQVAADMRHTAQDNGLLLVFHEAGSPDPAPVDNMVIAHIEQYSGDRLWTVTSFTRQ